MTDAQVWLTNLFFTSPCRIRVPWPFQWGSPLFDAGEAFAMMMASFVALVEVCFTPSQHNSHIFNIEFFLLFVLILPCCPWFNLFINGKKTVNRRFYCRLKIC